MRSNGQEPKPIRVVLDTNVLVSALLWRKRSWEIFQLASLGKIIICTSREILEEFSRVLFYPHISLQIQKIGKTPFSVTEELLTTSAYYANTPKISEIREDPSDNAILSCAVAAEPDYIISGDKHLLELKSFRGIPVLTPAQFLKRF